MKYCVLIMLLAVLLTACAITPTQPGSAPAKTTKTQAPVLPQPEFHRASELIAEPPENPRFVIARFDSQHPVDGPVARAIKSHLLRLGFEEAPSRETANLLVWYAYHSGSMGMRTVGEPGDIWGEQAVLMDQKKIQGNMDSIKPVFFSVQFVMPGESHVPEALSVVWRAHWSASLPAMTMAEFADKTLGKVLDQYDAVETQNEIAALRQMRERKLKTAVNNYMKAVMYRIQKNWRKPKYNVTGKKCKVKIVQSAVGEIRSHKVLTCDKDRGFRRSIEKAIKKSSPLPLPKQDNFDREELILIFQG